MTLSLCSPLPLYCKVEIQMKNAVQSHSSESYWCACPLLGCFLQDDLLSIDLYDIMYYYYYSMTVLVMKLSLCYREVW